MHGTVSCKYWEAQRILPIIRILSTNPFHLRKDIYFLFFLFVFSKWLNSPKYCNVVRNGFVERNIIIWIMRLGWGGSELHSIYKFTVPYLTYTYILVHYTMYNTTESKKRRHFFLHFDKKFKITCSAFWKPYLLNIWEKKYLSR